MAGAWQVLHKNPISAGGTQQLVCDTSRKASASNRCSSSALPGITHFSPSGIAPGTTHFGCGVTQLAATWVLGHPDAHQLPTSLSGIFPTRTLFALCVSITRSQLEDTSRISAAVSQSQAPFLQQDHAYRDRAYFL